MVGKEKYTKEELDRIELEKKELEYAKKLLSRDQALLDDSIFLAEGFEVSKPFFDYFSRRNTKS